MDVVIGLFQNRAEAEAGFNRLIEAGFAPADLSLVVRDLEAGSTDPALEPPAGEGRAEGAALGASSGAALGGFAGLLVGTGLLIIPGLGPVLVAGSLLSTLATAAVGAGMGAAAGGLAGALIGFGVSPAAAQLYTTGIEAGQVLVVGRAAPNQAAVAADIMRQAGALEVGLPEGEGE